MGTASNLVQRPYLPTRSTESGTAERVSTAPGKSDSSVFSGLADARVVTLLRVASSPPRTPPCLTSPAERFLKAAGVGTLASLAPGSVGRVLGANDRIRIAVAGLNGRGGEHVEASGSGKKGVEIVYLDRPGHPRPTPGGLKQIGDKAKPQAIQDVRKALDDKNLDAISIATPNHWHALMTIWACQAGKDVYVEKPCSHNVHEGRRAVAAARKYNRIVQHGTQSRSDPKWRAMAELVKSGKYGKLLISRGLVYKWGGGPEHPRRHRLQAGKDARRANSTSTSGSARPRNSRTTRTWSTTAGTGSGTSATATSATRASTRWTLPAG